MSSEKSRARKKKTYALFMFVIMFAGGVTAGGFALFGGGGGGQAQASPSPPAPPIARRNLSSFDDALALAPAATARVAFTSDRGLSGSDLGTFVAQRHASWTQVYGSPVSAEARILLPPAGIPLWLHALAGPAPRAPPHFTYRNATINEFFPGRQPWLGIVTNVEPLVAGVRAPGRPGPPYLIGLDEALDALGGRANFTARDLLGDLARRLPRDARFAGGSAVPVQEWDNRSVFGVVSEGSERYLLEAYLAGRSPNATRLQALQANATALGAALIWSQEAGGDAGEVVRVEARGNWSQVRDVLSAGGFLQPGE